MQLSLLLMHDSNIHKILSVLVIWSGISFLAIGVQKMNDSNYIAPDFVSGWLMGMAWIISGYAIGILWLIFIATILISQKMEKKARFSFTKIISLSLVLIFAVVAACVGTYLTWKYPYKLGPCDCAKGFWGPTCKPCLCQNGVCDDGQYGSGRCACDYGFSGNICDRCDERHKPEPYKIGPGETACDVCKTGFTGERCDECDRGYAGEMCEECADGWQPWTHSSDLFPLTISEDDSRHLCDECLPNHWGYNCISCPWGNDVPHVILTENEPIINGTRVADSFGKGGEIIDMQIKVNDEWITSYQYKPTNPSVLRDTQIKMVYDKTGIMSDWIALEDIRGVQCNNRGVCEDDETHQLENPDWDKTCTWDEYIQCSSDNDCPVSENCKGVCKGIGIPINSIWEAKVSGKLCSSNEDCIDDSIIIDEEGNTYTGGRCMTKGCCQESYHGSGNCKCDEKFFGDRLDNGFKEHFQLSPACDFCPGYDWITENPTTICSGGKGTCSASFGRTGAYLQMRCTCGEEVWIDRETGIVDPNKIIAWSGNLCECGDFDEDSKCDLCASGHWGPTCQFCPGGPGLRSCGGLGRGECNAGIDGDGTCNCALDRVSSWMLAPYVKRYASEPVGVDINGLDHTCTECAPNFFGEYCLRCDDTEMIKPSELDDIFQPGGSYQLGQGQSSIDPAPICHRGFCTLACGGGGWCNWGREGDGRCTCWSNLRLNEATWNPLDNVCIGNDRTKEQCPAYGYCSENSQTGRRSATMCGAETWLGGDKDMTADGLDWSPFDDWSGRDPGRQSSAEYNAECADKNKGVCYKWMPIDWRPSNSLITCVKEGN